MHGFYCSLSDSFVLVSNTAPTFLNVLSPILFSSFVCWNTHRPTIVWDDIYPTSLHLYIYMFKPIDPYIYQPLSPHPTVPLSASIHPSPPYFRPLTCIISHPNAAALHLSTIQNIQPGTLPVRDSADIKNKCIYPERS
jgi:hypothetical protein